GDLLSVHAPNGAMPRLCSGRIEGMSDQQVSPGIGLDVASLSIGILGGTGDQGRGLARRFALAGNPVVIGSRSAERAAAAAQALGGELGIRGMANADAAESADVVIVAVPWEGHAAVLASLAAQLAGKIVIDCVNPLAFDQRGCYPLAAAEGS